MPFDATPTNTVADVLRRARSLIDRPEKWCKHALERDGAFCVAGAVNMVVSGDARDLSGAWPPGVFRALNAQMDNQIVYFNNTRTHAEVMEAFDRAIALAEQEGV